MKKYILFLLLGFFVVGFDFSTAQSGCGDPVSNNYYCNGAPDCVFDSSTIPPSFYLPNNFIDDGSCIYDGVDNNGDGIPDNSLQGCEWQGYYNYNPFFSNYDPASYVNNYADQQEQICIPYSYGCIDESACNFDASSNATDGSCQYAFGCDTCSGETDGSGTVIDNDADNDGVCDVDEIVGCTISSACNYDSTATDSDNDSCTFAEQYYNCDGVCLNDSDGDEVCDELEIIGCQDSTACNYNENATDEGNCSFPVDLFGFDYVDCDNVCLNDSDGDGVCDEIEVAGCTDGDISTNSGIACNYDSSATDDDGSCEYSSCAGCLTESACNYDSSYTIADSDQCTFPEQYYNCDGICLNDSDGDGVCDELEIAGCQDLTACNYNENATDSADCTFAVQYYDCDNVCLNDSDGDGVCDEIEVAGCTDGDISTNSGIACNYDSSATDDDGSCEYSSCAGCLTESACNYDSSYTIADSDQCTFAEQYYNCDGICLNDSDGDGVCDELEIAGCQDLTACNYNENATDSADCTFAVQYYDCDNVCLNDSDGDGVCDELEIIGCIIPSACNYDEAATNEGDCTFATLWYLDTDSDGLGDPNNSTSECLQPEGYVSDNSDLCPNDSENDADGDGVCESDEVLGCTDSSACNYNLVATEEDNSCTYPDVLWYEDVDDDGLGDSNSSQLLCADIPQPLGFVLADDNNLDPCPNDSENDADGDGVCESDEILGCTDSSACNYDEDATEDNNTCKFIDGICETCVNGEIIDNDSDNDGVCDADEIDGCTNSNACNFNSLATEEDNSCVFATGCETCSGETDGSGTIIDNDSDNDGICDSNEVVGCQDDTACNFNINATDSGLCEYPIDSFGVDYVDCSGSCLNDADGDGVCDEAEITGCQEEDADNYDSNATDSGDCIYYGCLDESACNYDVIFTDNDGSCVYPVDVYGFNYVDCDGLCLNDSDGDGVCDEAEILGCTDSTACNYDSSATDDDGSCYNNDLGCGCDQPAAEQYYDCDGVCLNDSDGDGVCDELEISGCQDEAACNYDSTATDFDFDSCTYPEEIYLDCNGDCITDSDGDGICDELEIPGCTDSTACNYVLTATDDNGSCSYPLDIYGFNYVDCDGLCLNDSDGDGVCDEAEISGCTDSSACNYDETATDDDNSCTYPSETYLDCDGLCLNDTDGDGVCDELEISGCTDSSACNYDESATDDDSSCEFAVEYYDCNNICLNDSDGDGVCDELEISGCTDSTAFNYDETATDDNGTCEAVVEGCTNSTAANYNELANTDDGSCCFVTGCTDETALNYNANACFDDGSCVEVVEGCTDSDACNYNSEANTENNSCTYPAETYLDCDGVCLNDADGDGVCDELEISGCTDSIACNYDETATDDDSSCTYPAETYLDCDGLCLNDSDGDGVCDEVEISGCTDSTACNYDETATDDDSSCTYPAETYLDCDGLCLNDSDGDGVCNELEISGCIDTEACNFNPLATDLDDSCTYPDEIYLDCDGECLNDSDGDGICDELELLGCTDPSSCTFSPTATDDNGSCTYPSQDYLDCFDNCINDTDADGVCDELEISGCTDSSACNYDETATDDDNSCTYPSETYLDCDGLCLNDTDGDGVCDELEISGCTDSSACNYDESATDDDSSCEFAVEYYDCNNICLNDSDGDGVCDELEILGCTDSTAFNYDETATDDNGTCEAVVEGCTNSTAANYNELANTDDGSCCFVTGCTDETALNYNANACFDDGSCIEVVEGCTDSDAFNYNSEANTDDGSCIEVVEGCLDATACNYNELANTDDGSCYNNDLGCGCDLPAAEQYYNCDGLCLNDSDGDGVCDELEISGCTDSTACNYDESATDDDGSCYNNDLGCGCDLPAAEQYYNCDGLCLNDIDGDGVCDELEIAGCIDPNACNYDDNPTTDYLEGSCTYPDEIYLDCNGDCITDTDGDGVCDEVEVPGCQDELACNYNSEATDFGECDFTSCVGCMDETACNYNENYTIEDNDSCTFPVDIFGFTYLDCNGTCINDNDGDGVCDENEIPGCTDSSACNYNATATDDDDSCTFIDGICETCENGVVVDNDADNDGICDEVDICPNDFENDSDGDGICESDEIAGCQDATACNYNEFATDDDGSCILLDGICETCSEDGLSVIDNDADDDGICDADEIAGCQDAAACNYDETATDDDGSCLYLDAIGICGGDCPADDDNDGVCDAVYGCTDSNYQEFDADATDDDGSCLTLMGCLDNNYYEYNPDAVVDNGTCLSKKGDADGDDFVNLSDLFIVLDHWLQITEAGQNGDVNQDEIVNLSDLFDVLDHWLQ